jgi:hypothetical protein
MTTNEFFLYIRAYLHTHSHIHTHSFSFSTYCNHTYSFIDVKNDMCTVTMQEDHNGNTNMYLSFLTVNHTYDDLCHQCAMSDMIQLCTMYVSMTDRLCL